MKKIISVVPEKPQKRFFGSQATKRGGGVCQEGPFEKIFFFPGWKIPYQL